MADSTGRTALVAGSSGLVGGKLLTLLLHAQEYGRVHALSRRPLAFTHPRLANRVVRFDAPLDTQLKGLRCEDAYCCLGTTIKDAGSKQAFRAVDSELVLKFARFAVSAGVQRFLLVSAIGANAASKTFYLRVKGETEKALEALRFRSLDIFQPSFLIGPHHGRPMEMIVQPFMQLINPLLLGNASRYRAIDAALVAAAMVGAARAGRLGVNRYSYDAMRSLAKSAPTVN